jgi:hypothetical protein
LEKKNKKDKRFSKQFTVTDDKTSIDGISYAKDTLYICDMLRKFDWLEVKEILKVFGKVASFEVKKLHKYQLIKANIYLSQ